MSDTSADTESDPPARPVAHARPADTSRPKPQFGEYATPEEQRARIQDPAPWQREALTPVMTDAPDPVVPASPATAERRPRPVDRVVTFALLAYGLVNVISSVPAFLDYGAYAETLLSMLGVDVQITDPAAGRAWGIAAVLVLAVGWCATAVVSWWSVRRGRLTWWIPLVGGILFTFVSGTLMAVPLMNDPAVWQALVESAGG
ncbi:DUF6264 family protein [Microbacterium sp. QXD-8]|uniref:DUF6264 family protein n=1 Tax=Microbacterium psychrotolerans TaxID=3068321 RepID=A0ABU0Z8Q1_9MICO|nr:DUF6264 family protein [Microbacterium sp. QXD-8]MDQ7879886.1 DUF6264 family protein [Microbacterium sp. QXD-8]